MRFFALRLALFAFLCFPLANMAYSQTVTATPTFSLAPGTYNAAQTLSIADATAGATIYYTTDNTTPTTSSAVYTGPIALGPDTSMHVGAIAKAPGDAVSAVLKGYYDIITPTAAPVAYPPGGSYTGYPAPSVTLTESAPNATIYYTTDGSYPTKSSPTYTAPIAVTTGMEINAYATAPGYSTGAESQSTYTLTAPAPVITPASGSNNASTATVTISSTIPGTSSPIPGAVIYYSTNGTIPTTASSVYSGPFTETPSTTTNYVVQAIATVPGFSQSPNAVSSFTVDAPTGALASAVVNTTPVLTIPAQFLGLSVDVLKPPVIMGQPSTGVNTSYVNLLKNLTATATAPLLFRISTDDYTVAEVQAATAPLTQLAASINVQYTLGVDLWNSNLNLAEEEQSAWQAGIPSSNILAFEIGNEPDVYPYNGARPNGYTWAQYLSQFQQWKRGIDPNGNLGILAPAMGGQTNWIPSAISALQAGTLTPTIVGQHAYLGDDYLNPLTNPPTPWPTNYLLQPSSTTYYPNLLSSFVSQAHASGYPFRVSEMNSFYDGGAPGISNSFSSALWAVDNMFAFVQEGVDGVNWHSGKSTIYDLFEFQSTTKNGIATFATTQVNPLYYGLLLFSRMAGNHAQLLSTTTQVANSANVSIWSTIDSAGTVRVVVLNKDTAASGNVSISLPGYTAGTVQYLSAASYQAQNGVTFGGQTFDGTPDGTIQGTPIASTISSQTGNFTLPNVPITSAALITFLKP